MMDSRNWATVERQGVERPTAPSGRNSGEDAAQSNNVSYKYSYEPDERAS
jgi:hypothetical protein